MKWQGNGKLGASISRKLGDGDFGSFEFAAWFEGDMPAGSELDSELAGLEAWLSAQVAARIKAFQNKIHAAPLVQPRQTVDDGPNYEADAAPPTEPSTGDYLIFPVDKIRIEMTTTGKKIGKVFGGAWKKYGVTAWPDVLDSLIGSIENMQPGEELMPPRPNLRAKAVANDKGKPSKVIAWME